jgi:hypothetical protein
MVGFSGASALDRPARSVITTLVNNITFNAITTSLNSEGVVSSGFREFILYFTMVSANTPTRIQFIPQFSNDAGTTWFSYLQGPWASMMFEDTVMATAITECYSGPVFATRFRLRTVATGTTSTNTFRITASVEFRS